MSEDIRRKLEDEAARQGVTFIVSKDGVLLEPGQCPTCRRWSGEPETCEHVDYNVGVMVRCVMDLEPDVDLMLYRKACAMLGEWIKGDSIAESLAHLLLKLWALR
jgi:hypothetical protein